VNAALVAIQWHVLISSLLRTNGDSNFNSLDTNQRVYLAANAKAGEISWKLAR